MVMLMGLVLTGHLHANSTDNDGYVRTAKGVIDWQCTAKCAVWWRCRLSGFFLRKCDRPAGCDCSRFAWER